ncbi:hypothetical protein SAMN05660284_00123 [Formivibrio citricus]|uniref:Uncharacterized protein n=1 Tax=Formivibrio citricus TaxID=83765 RepID=A0A1I4V4Q5_9NEIS|nr:hypothetical protein [Formivibrio citricus]SFM96148.1 hypothetical protein SAMN05660284_00123 [Formivibrio citricus]
MILKRLLPLLLCLLALYPAWVSASAPVQMQGHEAHEMQSASSHHCHDVQDVSATDAGEKSAGVTKSCDTGNCLMHCLVPLVRPSIALPSLPGFTYHLPSSVSFSSIALETPSRPPSSL